MLKLYCQHRYMHLYNMHMCLPSTAIRLQCFLQASCVLDLKVRAFLLSCSQHHIRLLVS